MKIKVIGFISPRVLKERTPRVKRSVKPLKVSFGSILMKALEVKRNERVF